MKKNKTTILNRYMADKAIMQKIQQEIAGLKWGKSRYDNASEQYQEQLIWGQYLHLKTIWRLQEQLQFPNLEQRVNKTLIKSKLWILQERSDCSPMQALRIWAYYRGS